MLIIIKNGPYVTVGVSRDSRIVVEYFRGNACGGEILHGETDVFAHPVGVTGARKDISVPVAGGLEVKEFEGGFNPVADSNAWVANGLHPYLVGGVV